MSVLETDKCYKFYYDEKNGNIPNDKMQYEENKEYNNGNYFFFTISQATDSIKNLLYFMEFGNSIIEIVNNIELRKNAVESSPNHFVSKKIVTGNSYDFDSNLIRKIILNCVSNCRDFSEQLFLNIIVNLIINRGFKNAKYIYKAVLETKQVCLDKTKIKCAIQSTVCYFLDNISLCDVICYDDILKYVDFLESLNLK